jgi:hypothetical protein
MFQCIDMHLTRELTLHYSKLCLPFVTRAYYFHAEWQSAAAVFISQSM